MASTTSGRRSRKLSPKGIFQYLIATAIMVGSAFILASAFDVPGLKPVTESCRPAIEVIDPAAHNECTAYIDALRADTWYGIGAAFGVGLIIFLINRLRDRFPGSTFAGMAGGIVLTVVVIFVGIPALDDVLNDNDIVGEAIVRGALATFLWLMGLTLFMRWDYLIARFKPRLRRSSS